MLFFFPEGVLDRKRKTKEKIQQHSCILQLQFRFFSPRLASPLFGVQTPAGLPSHEPAEPHASASQLCTSIRMETGSSGGRRLPKTESAEMRWVVPGGAYEEDEIDSSDDGDGGTDTPTAALGSRGGGGGYSDAEEDEEDALLRQRLVRTGPRADSFDVEALDVPGLYRHQVCLPSASTALIKLASISLRARWLGYCLGEAACKLFVGLRSCPHLSDRSISRVRT